MYLIFRRLALALMGLSLVCGQVPGQTVTSDDAWVLDTSYGVPIWIAHNELVHAGSGDRREMSIFMEAQYFTPENLRKLILAVASEYREPTELWLTLATDRVMLQRDIDDESSYQSSYWKQKPDGRAGTEWVEEHERLPHGYHWVRYRRRERMYYSRQYIQELYEYNPNPTNSDTVEVVLQDKPTDPPYTGDPVSDLLIAANEGDAATVRSLLSDGANANSKDEDGETALMLATRKKRKLDTVKALVENGADVNTKSNNNSTALMFSVDNDESQITLLLLEKGADVNAQDNHKRTPLLFSRNPEITRLLLNRGADINQQDDSGNSALMMSSYYESGLPNAKVLLARGAKLDLKNDAGDSALTMAANGGVAELVRILLENGANVDARNNAGDTPLLLSRSMEVVKLLVEKGADVNARNSKAETPLILARDKEIAQLLLERGADVNAKDNDGVTPLMRAADRLWVADLAELLISKGAELSTRDNLGETALSVASKHSGFDDPILDVLEDALRRKSETFSVSTSRTSDGPKPPLIVKRDPLDRGCDEVSSVAFSPDGRLIAAMLEQCGLAGNRTIGLWDVSNGKLTKSIQGPRGTSRGIQFSPDGRQILSEHGQAWDLETGERHEQIGKLDSAPGNKVSSFVLSPDGRLSASSGKLLGERIGITIRDVTSGKVVRFISTGTDVRELGFNGDATTLNAAIVWDSFAIWDVNTGNLIRKARTGWLAGGLGYSGDGKLLAVAGLPFLGVSSIDIVDASTGEVNNHLIGPGGWHARPAFSPDRNLLAVDRYPADIELWDLRTHKLIFILEGHRRLVRSVVFSPDGRLLASGGGRNETKIWSVGTGELIVTLVAFNDGNWIAYTPDGYYDRSEGASKYISWRLGGNVEDEATYRAHFFKPEIVAVRLLH